MSRARILYLGVRSCWSRHGDSEDDTRSAGQSDSGAVREADRELVPPDAGAGPETHGGRVLRRSPCHGKSAAAVNDFRGNWCGHGFYIGMTMEVMVMLDAGRAL